MQDTYRGGYLKCLLDLKGSLYAGKELFPKSVKKRHEHIEKLIEELIECREFRERYMEMGGHTEYKVTSDGKVIPPEKYQSL